MVDVMNILTQPKKVKVRIEHCLTELQQWDDLVYRITENADTQPLDAKKKLAEAVGFCMGMEAYIRDQVKQLSEVTKETIDKILLLDNPAEQNVLLERYIQGMTMIEIAENMNKSYDNVKAIHKLGTKHLHEILSSQ